MEMKDLAKLIIILVALATIFIGLTVGFMDGKAIVKAAKANHYGAMQQVLREIDKK